MTNPYWPLPYPDSLGGMVGADDVADAVEATLAEWAPFYVAALSARLSAQRKIGQRGQPNAPLFTFGAWVNEGDYRSIGTSMPAAYETRVTGTVGEPYLDRNHGYIATWRANVTVTVFGTTWQQARDMTSWYEKIVRWCILQHRSLGGFAMLSGWAGTQYRSVEHSGSRTLGEAVLGFDVKVADTIDLGRGPVVVPEPLVVPGQDPTVETTVLELTNVGPGGSLEE